MDRPRARRLLIAALLIGAGLVVFGRLTLDPTAQLVGPQRGGLNDLTDYFLPQTEYKILAWQRHGSLPTWDPHLQLGRPIVGNPQSALYYPATWLMLLTGQSRLASWLLVAHHVFAGWGMYLLCRRYGCGWTSSLIGGFIFLAAPSLVAHTAEGHMTMTWAAAWIPWALVAFERLRRGRPYSVVMLSAVLSLAFFAGHAQTVYYLVLALCAFVVIDVVRGYLGGLAHAAHSTSNWVSPAALAINFALAGMLTAGLVAVDLLPIWLTSQQTTRVQQGLSASDASQMGAATANLQQLVYPFALGKPGQPVGGGNYWEMLIYVGAVPLALAIFAACACWRKYPTGRFTAMFLVALVFSLSASLPLYGWLHSYLPGLAHFRVPSRAMLFASAAVSVLAAIALQQLYEWHAHTPAISKYSRIAAIIVARVAAALLAFELAWHAGMITRTASYATFASRNAETESRDNSVAKFRVLAAHDLLDDGEVYRRNLARVRGYDPFLLLRYAALLQATLGDRPFLVGEAPGYTTEANLQYDRAMLQMLGVRYALLPAEIEPPPRGWTLASIERQLIAADAQARQAQSTYSYENERFLPRAFVIGRTFHGRDLATIDPATTLLIPPNAPPGDERQPLGPAEIITYEPAHVVIEAELVAPGYVVLTDVHALGWKATVNGQPAAIVPVNIGLRGVHLPAGKHRIEMKFSPPLWTPGVAVSLMALAISVYLAVNEMRAIKSAAGDGKAVA
jgi:hypothetical protein